MKIKLLNIGGKIVSNTESCIIKENTTLENLTLSSIRLKQFESSSWYEDVDQDIIYLSVSGFGTIEMNNREYSISPNEIFFVKKGIKHRINNTFDEDMYLIFVTNKKETLDD